LTVFLQREPPIMFLTIQFPIADARSFLKEGSPRISLELSKNKDVYVRCFGKVRLRKNKNLLTKLPLDWVNDIHYVSADTALKVPDLGQYYEWHQKNKESDPPRFLLKPSYLSRRLFFDSIALARVEVGLKVETPVVLDKNHCLSVIKDYLTLPTKVLSLTDKSGYANKYLANQGEDLAKLFLHATTPKVNTTDFDKNSVMECNPLLFFEYSEDAKSPFGKFLYRSILPDEAKKLDVSNTNGVNLAYYEYKHNKTCYGVWFIGCNDKNKEKVRLLKLCLLRLHAEQEVLKNILIFIGKLIENGNQGNIKIDNLNKYLSSATKAIYKKSRYGILQGTVLDSAKKCQTVTSETELICIENKKIALEKNLSLIESRQTREKFILFLKNFKGFQVSILSHNIIGNNNIVNSYVHESFKNAEKSSSSDLKEKLDTLITKVNDLCNKIPNNDDKEKTALYLKQFVEHATLPKPDKTMLGVTGKGIIDAAKAIADVAKPIAEAVGVVLAFFP